MGDLSYISCSRDNSMQIVENLITSPMASEDHPSKVYMQEYPS